MKEDIKKSTHSKRSAADSYQKTGRAADNYTKTGRAAENNNKTGRAADNYTKAGRADKPVRAKFTESNFGKEVGNKADNKVGNKTGNKADNKTDKITWNGIVKLTREENFDNNRGLKPEYRKGPGSDFNKSPRSESDKGPGSEYSKGPGSDFNKGPRSESGKSPRAEYGKGPRAEYGKGPRADHGQSLSLEPNKNSKPEHSKVGDSNYKGSSKYNSVHNSELNKSKEFKYKKAVRPETEEHYDSGKSRSERSNAQRPEYNNHKASFEKGACQYLHDCGGCHILKQSYEAELKEKQKTVENLIKSYCKVETIIGMKQPEHYRNKVHVVFDHDRKGNPVSGVYEEKTHHVVPVEKCLIHNQKADEIIASIRGMLKSFKIKTYDEDTGYGLLRHVLIRTGFASKEIMVVLVLVSPILPSKNNFVKALLKQHPEITTIVTNVNDRNTSMVLGNKEQVIYGKGYIEDSLCGKTFRISAKSFYQVNPAQTEVLYGKAIEMAELTGSEIVIDAYCGIGTIGILASDHAGKVIGVELNKDAVKDALINVKRNEAANIEIYNNDAGDFMSQMAIDKEPVDVVFLDPPRTGSNEKFLDALALLKPRKVIYVSCNPITLERDLMYLVRKGYKAVKAQPVDMFPWTEHVETVCLLSYIR